MTERAPAPAIIDVFITGEVISFFEGGGEVMAESVGPPLGNFRLADDVKAHFRVDSDDCPVIYEQQRCCKILSGTLSSGKEDVAFEGDQTFCVKNKAKIDGKVVDELSTNGGALLEQDEDGSYEMDFSFTCSNDAILDIDTTDIANLGDLSFNFAELEQCSPAWVVTKGGDSPVIVFEASTLEIVNLCGDGVRSEHEECDDGNTKDGDGCSSTCTTMCGDGFVAGDEECDDGNNLSGDGCSADCLEEYVVEAIKEYCPADGSTGLATKLDDLDSSVRLISESTEVVRATVDAIKEDLVDVDATTSERLEGIQTALDKFKTSATKSFGQLDATTKKLDSTVGAIKAGVDDLDSTTNERLERIELAADDVNNTVDAIKTELNTFETTTAKRFDRVDMDADEIRAAVNDLNKKTIVRFENMEALLGRVFKLVCIPDNQSCENAQSGCCSGQNSCVKTRDGKKCVP